MRSLPLVFLFAWSLVGRSEGAPPLRDVLATAFSYPFLTSAEVELCVTDTQARVTGPGGPALVRYPGVASATVDGAPVRAQRLGPDLLQVDLPPGVHELALLTTGEAVPAAELTPGQAVGSPEEFKTRAARLASGEELVVRDGIYDRWKLDCQAEGTADRPIVIRPQTPGGVVFRRDSVLTLRGHHVVLRGFRFEQCRASTVLNVLGSDCRVTQCHFLHCGVPVSTFAHIVEIGMGSHRNRVDHCYFTGSKSMSLAQKITAVDGVGLNNRFDHNLFRDIYRYWINGQENIQIGQNQRDPTGKARPQCLVEFNVFDHAWGDGEIISSKSTGNTIRHNLAVYCRRSSFTLRGGEEARFEGNVMLQNGDGVRVMGRRHTLINNLILDQAGWGIYLETGSLDGQNMVASEGSLMAHNTIANCAAGAIGAMPVSEERPHRPRGNEFRDNLFVGSTSALSDPDRLPGSTVVHNLFWEKGTVLPVAAGKNAIVADPRLQGRGQELRPAPDGPGRDVGAPAPHPGLPPVPPRPLLDPSLFQGKSVFAQDLKKPLQGWRGDAKAAGEALSLQDGQASLNDRLPRDVLLEWDYQPAGSFAAEARLTLSGVTLKWGGAGSDGKPAGVLELLKEGEVVADGTDALLPSQQFRYKGGMNFQADARTVPDPQMWYRFTLLKRGARFVVLLANPRGDPLPVIVWEDRDGPQPAGELRIEQRGAGRWRRLAAWACEYAGDAPLAALESLKATPFGGGRVALRWKTSRPGLTFEVYRDTQADFKPSEANRIAAELCAGSFDDFAVQPGTRYFYQVRAVNRLGRISPEAATEAITGAEGPLYRVLPVRLAQIEAPLVLMEDPETPAYAWAPRSVDPAMAEPPAQGGVEFHFRIEKEGEYVLWGLVRSPDGSRDSFYVSRDGGPPAIWYTGVHPGFAWSRIGSRVRLAAGEHRLRIQHREPGAAVGAVLVTDDGEFAP